MNGLLTDLYELTMAAGYFEAGKAAEKATFEFTIRRLPAHRNFALIAGLPQVVDYLLNLSFTSEKKSTICAASRSSHASVPGVLRLPAQLPFHRRSLRRSRRHSAVRRRARAHHSRSHHRSADSGDVPALGDHVPDPDRDQSRALRGGRRRTAQSWSSARAARTRRRPARWARAPPTSAAARAPATRSPDSATASR